MADINLSQLHNIKNRIQAEILTFQEKLNLLEPEIRAYDEAEDKIKRITFLIDSRKNLENLRQSTSNNIDIGPVKNQILKDLKKTYKVISACPTKNIPNIQQFKREDEEDIRNIRQLSHEFSIIDKLTYLLYITTYTNSRISDKNFAFNKKSSLGLFSQLRIIFNRNWE